MASIVNFYRGPQSKIDEIKELEDGRLYFATDTKKIQMDCVHLDSLNNELNKRITFGGSTGIYYGTKTFEADTSDFYFTLDDLDTDETELPSVNDLILNSDGSFYRVKTVMTAQGQVETVRLTLSGGGGGPGTGSIGIIYRTYISDRISYYTMQDKDIPIIFSCYSSMEDSPVTAEIIVNNKSMEHIENIKKDQAVTINLASYMSSNILKSNDSNTIKISLIDDYDNTATMTYTVYLYDMYITIPDTQVMPQPSDYEFVGKPYGGTTGNLTNRMVIYELRRENSESIVWSASYNTNADKGENISYLIPHQEHGTYILTVYLKAGIPNSTKFLTSPIKTVQIPFYNASESAPLITVSNAPDVELTQYDKVKIGYMVTYAATTTSDINLIIEIDRGNGRELLRSTQNNIPNGEYKYWDVSFDEVGIYYLTIELANSEYSKALSPISVKAYDKDVPAIDTEDSSLRLLLSSKNRSNTEIDKDVWTSKFGSEEITCTFSGFNWETNGWISDASGSTSLHLTNGAKLVVPYSPFAPDSSNYGAEKSGRTIELDFKISNIRDLSKPCITCKSSNFLTVNGERVENINTGIQIYGNKSQMSSLSKKSKYEDMSGWTTMFKENTRVHLTYVINNGSDNPARIFYTFLNGVTSSLSRYEETDQFVDLSGIPSEFIFDSTYMDIDIYNIRVYSLSKTPTFVLKNYIADSATPEEAAAKWVDNDILDVLGDGNTGINIEDVISLGNIPYMVFYDGRRTGSKKDEGWQETDPDYDGTVYPVSDESRLPTAKKDFRHMEMYYVDPKNPSKNIPEGTIVSCYGQGTSSMEYPVKNLRIYFKDKKGYALFDDVPAVRLYTLKADFMESSSSHNTGTANALNKLYKSIGLQSPAAPYHPSSQNMLTAILGKPIVCFYKPYKATPEFPDYYKYIGRYNFNYDKATHEIFGFESLKADKTANGKPYGYLLEEDGMTLRAGFNTALEFDEENERTYYRIPSLEATEDQKVTIAANDEKTFETEAKKGPLYEYKEQGKGVTTVQCWEFLNNTAPLVGFRKAWNEEEDKANGYKEWTGAFEARYPEHTDEASSDKRAMARVVNWLASTNRHPDVVAEYLIAQGIEATEENIETERTARLTKFTNEFNDYFLRDFVSFYYVLTEFLMMIDSRGKNMMFACYDADPDNNTGHWLPIFYDMDTMLGVDNSGNLRFSYDAEDDLPDTFNLTATYNETQYSVLWCNFKEAFFEDIKDMYQKLRQGGAFNYNTILANYNNNQANAWNETYINEDANYKYINPLVNNYKVYFDSEGNIISEEEASKIEGATSKTAVDYLYAAQGTRSEHRAYWLDRRFNYLDSKYDYVHEILQTNSAPLSVRLNSSIEKAVLPFNADQTLTSQYEQYVTIQHLNGAYEGPVRLHAGDTTTISVPITTSTDQECYIFGLDNISDMGLQADKYYNKFQLQSVVKLRTLETGCFIKGWENANLGDVNKFDISGKVPYLEYLNIQNCSGISELDMSASPYLQEIYAYGTNLTSVSFFNGGNLKHVELPATTNRLFLRSQLYFDTFTKRSDEEIQTIETRERDKIALSIRNSMTKLGRSEEQISAAIANIELTDIQREHLTCAGYDYLTTLRISNCPLVDSKSFIKKLLKDNGDNTYTTNLQNFRMEDVNWTITKDECVLETANGKTYVKNIPILDVLVSINGIDNADRITTRLEAGNDYFAGTITIENDSSFGIDELTLYNLYGKLFPGLEFKYTTNNHCTKAYLIGINNALNQIEQMYSKKCAAHEINTIAANLADWFTPCYTDDGKNWDTSHVPPLPKTSSGKFDYTFVGWALEPQAANSFNEGPEYETLEDQLAAARASCKIIVNKNEDGTYEAKLNNFTLTESSFNENQEIHFYPIYVGIIRYYTVNFIWKKDGADQILKSEIVKYATGATPPSPPQWIELPEENVTLGYVYPFTGYNIPYDDVRNEINTYAQFGEKVHMSKSPTDASYFANVGQGDEYETGIALQLKNGFEGEALTVPKNFDGYKVLKFQIEDYTTNAPNLKRIFFEENNEILHLANIRNGQENFQYCDFSMLNKLKTIDDTCFTGCANLVCTALPDSITEIHDSAFYGCTKISISKLPKNLYYMEPHAFDNCTSIKEIDINNSALNAIADFAFLNCTNLTIKGANINSSITQVGEQSFAGCTSLVMNFGLSGEDCSLEKIGKTAFRGTPNLNIQNLPARLEELPNQCFYGLSGTPSYAKFTVIPRSVKTIGNYVFQFRTMSEAIYIENPDITIGENAFANTYGMKTIYVPSSMIVTTTTGWGSGAEVKPY